MPPDLGENPALPTALPSVEPDNLFRLPHPASLRAGLGLVSRPAASGPSHPIPTDHHDQIPAACYPSLFSLAPSRLVGLESWCCSDMQYVVDGVVVGESIRQS